MTLGIVVLCRYSSKRLPGKILCEINGLSVLGHIVARIRYAVPEVPISVATSSDSSDDPVAEYCRRARLECFRGSLEDVAGRFLSCAQGQDWEFAVRINGDNLFVDPETLRVMVGIAQTGRYDLVSNVPGRTFPKGMSVEVVRTSFYAQVMAEVTNQWHREHATSWLYENPSVGERYVYENQVCPLAGGYQLAIDSEDDIVLAQQIFDRTGLKPEDSGLRTIWPLISSATPTRSPWKGCCGPLLIAEIGGNHEGDFARAKLLTELAIQSGVDCIKFQIYRGDSLVSAVESPERHKHFQRFELLPEEHVVLAKMCKEAGVGYMSSVWDMEMLDSIDPYIDIYKVGSGDMTAWPILRALARRKKPILLSTGLSTLDEVLQTVAQIQAVDARYRQPEWLCLLQCTSMYPIPDHDANLRVMETLRAFAGVSVGYSDHTLGSVALCAAAAMGAETLEFHFTDSREGKDFRDHQVSLTREEVIQLRHDIVRITNCRGNGFKTPQASELAEGHEVSFRRGVYLATSIKAGEQIMEKDLVLLRPAHGTDARDQDRIIGAVALRDIDPHRAIFPEKDYQCS